MSQANQHIIYTPHSKIDKQKWDACINHDPNGLLYAQSFYLDTLAGKWDALVMNDYDGVMPLPVRKKMGIPYIFQPSMTPVLGVFGKAINTNFVGTFLQAIPASFKLWDISLHHHNSIPGESDYRIFPRNNYVLDLSGDYNSLEQQYHTNTKRNIAKAISSGCSIKSDTTIDDVIAICRVEFPGFTKVEEGLFEKLKSIYLHYKNNSVTLGVLGPDGILLSAATFIFFNGRVYYWLVGNTPGSRNYGSSSLLIDHFIRSYAGKQLLLDFEGSDDPGVAQFYKRFGALHEPYTTIFHNKLPFLLRWLKPVPSLYKRLIS